MATLKGFFSYARNDDLSDGGRISKFVEHITNEYRLLTGEAIEIFIDTKLDWGSKWKERIQENLSNVIFFIAIITPNYLTRTNCIE